MNVTNQTPVELSPVYQTNIKDPFDPAALLKSTLVAPLFTPLVSGQPVAITHNNHNVTDDEIRDNILRCCGVAQDPAAEAWVKQLMSRCLLYYNANTTLNVLSLFQVQAALKNNMPLPSPTIMYMPATDIIPTAKQFLAGQCEADKFFASMAFCTRVQTLGVYFVNALAFDDFKAWLNQQVAVIAGSLPPQTTQLLADFQNLSLANLTESLLLRNQDTDNNDPFSFARVLVSYIMNYVAQTNPTLAGIMPFDVGELFCPKTIVFVNIEKHAHATAKQITDEWDMIKQSMQMKLNLVSANKLQQLTGALRAAKRAQAAAAAYQQAIASGPVRSANIRFRRKAPTTANIAALVKRIFEKMNTMNHSQNIYKASRMTFQKPNRRDPDDFNKMGKSVSTKYYPDLHFYIDTSGSISEENYEDAIKACIMMAKRFNINVYFNSFSHFMSTCTCLKTKDKSVSQIYSEFQRVPKVTGGTNFEQIWHYINKSKKRLRELSIIITDFEWTAPNYFVQQPPHLYYMPCSKMDYDVIKQNCQTFANSMLINDPNIARHILV